MERCIFRYRHPGPKPADEVERILAHPDVKLIEDTGRMLLVEGNAAQLAAIARDLPAWAYSTTQHSIRLPTPPEERIKRRLPIE